MRLNYDRSLVEIESPPENSQLYYSPEVGVCCIARTEQHNGVTAMPAMRIAVYNANSLNLCWEESFLVRPAGCLFAVCYNCLIIASLDKLYKVTASQDRKFEVKRLDILRPFEEVKSISGSGSVISLITSRENNVLLDVDNEQILQDPSCEWKVIASRYLVSSVQVHENKKYFTRVRLIDMRQQDLFAINICPSKADMVEFDFGHTKFDQWTFDPHHKWIVELSVHTQTSFSGIRIFDLKTGELILTVDDKISDIWIHDRGDVWLVEKGDKTCELWKWDDQKLVKKYLGKGKKQDRYVSTVGVFPLLQKSKVEFYSAESTSKLFEVECKSFTMSHQAVWYISPKNNQLGKIDFSTPKKPDPLELDWTIIQSSSSRHHNAKQQ